MITFGFESSVVRFMRRSSRNNISNHAVSLLSDLLDARNEDSQVCYHLPPKAIPKLMIDD